MYKDNQAPINGFAGPATIAALNDDEVSPRIPLIHMEFDLLRNKTDALIDKLQSVSIVLHGELDKVRKDSKTDACVECPAYQTNLPSNFESVKMRLDKAHDLLDDIYNMLGMKLGETYS